MVTECLYLRRSSAGTGQQRDLHLHRGWWRSWAHRPSPSVTGECPSIMDKVCLPCVFPVPCRCIQSYRSQMWWRQTSRSVWTTGAGGTRSSARATSWSPSSVSVSIRGPLGTAQGVRVPGITFSFLKNNFNFYFLAMLHSLWDLISLTRDWTCVPLHWKVKL